MTLRAVPPWSSPTVTTAGSYGLISRATMVCSALTISAATMMASWPRWGMAPWHDVPRTSTRNQSVLAMRGPGSQLTVPASTSLQMCMANAPSTPSQHTGADHHLGALAVFLAGLEHDADLAVDIVGHMAQRSASVPSIMAIWQS